MIASYLTGVAISVALHCSTAPIYQVKYSFIAHTGTHFVCLLMVQPYPKLFIAGSANLPADFTGVVPDVHGLALTRGNTTIYVAVIP